MSPWPATFVLMLDDRLMIKLQELDAVASTPEAGIFIFLLFLGHETCSLSDGFDAPWMD